MTETKKTLVSMRGVDKIFYGKHANKGVDFELLAGEVHSILGENGAGKTTLMNCLAGIYLPDAGSIYIEGKPVFIQMCIRDSYWGKDRADKVEKRTALVFPEEG